LFQLYDEQRSQYQIAKAAKDKLQTELQTARAVYEPLRQRHAAAVKREQIHAQDLKTLVNFLADFASLQQELILRHIC
jgi:hypothetical protein